MRPEPELSAEATEPFVSIGMPVYNGELYLRKALDSLLSQTYLHFELIISDNVSEDATPDICREYAARDSRIRYIRQEENCGARGNFLKVLSYATGDYFMWAGCDDFWAPDFIRLLVEDLERHPEAGVAFCSLDRVSETGEFCDHISYGGSENPNDMTPLQLALRIAKNTGYHYIFIYGLFRRELLVPLARELPHCASPDQIFMSYVALKTRFRYVDQLLHIRTKHTVSFQDRYANDALAKALKSPFVLWKMPLNSYQYLSSRSDLDRKQKLWIPLLSLRWAITAFRLTTMTYLWYLSTRMLGEPRRKKWMSQVRRLKYVLAPRK